MHKSAKLQRTDIPADHLILIDQDIRAYIVRLPGIIRHNVCIPLTPFSGIFFEIAALRLLDSIVVCKHVVKLLGDLHLDNLIRLRFDLPAERLQKIDPLFLCFSRSFCNLDLAVRTHRAAAQLRDRRAPPDAAHKRQYKDSRSGGDLAFCHTK